MVGSLLALSLGCTAIATPMGSAPPDILAANGITGELTVHREVRPAHLEHARPVWVWLPPGYHKGNERYPVLYMHDGNNLFDPSIAFGGHEWGVDETADRLVRSGKIPPIIIVGVANSPARIDEYTWTASEIDGKRMGGLGAKYAKFLVSELKPFIDKTYRTKADRKHTGVMGSSLGGLISLYLARHHGEVFGKIGAMSPSIWWDDRAVLAEAGKLRKDSRLWLDFGTKESDDPARSQFHLDNAREFGRRAKATGLTLFYLEDEGATHHESAWSRRLPQALSFLFAR